MLREAIDGFLTLGPKRSATGYTGEDLRFLCLLTRHCALTLERAETVSALGAVHAGPDPVPGDTDVSVWS